jgi:hypothetical protein
MVWLKRTLYEEMYTRICEENGPADPEALSRLAKLLAKLWWGSGSSGDVGHSGC